MKCVITKKLKNVDEKMHSSTFEITNIFNFYQNFQQPYFSELLKLIVQLHNYSRFRDSIFAEIWVEKMMGL